MKKINLSLGILLLILFVFSGQYLNMIDSKHLMDNVSRMEIRANHIYVLFVSLLNILSFPVVQKAQHIVIKSIDVLFRVLLIASGIFSVLSFWFEHDGNLQNRGLTFYTVLFSLIAIGLVLLIEVINKVLMSKKESYG